MRRNEEDRDCGFPGAVIPKNPIRGRRRLFGVRLENRLAVRTVQRHIFMGLKAGMAGILRHQADRLDDGLVSLLVPEIRFQFG